MNGIHLADRCWQPTHLTQQGHGSAAGAHERAVGEPRVGLDRCLTDQNVWPSRAAEDQRTNSLSAYHVPNPSQEHTVP